MAQEVVVENAFDVFDKVNVDDIEDYVNKHMEEKKAEKGTKKNSKLVDQENNVVVYNKPRLDDQVNNNNNNKSNNRRKEKYRGTTNAVANASDANQGRAPRGQGNAYRSNGSGQNAFANNGGGRFYKDFRTRDPGYVSDGRGNHGGRDEGRGNHGGRDEGRGYGGGCGDGLRGYRGGYNGDGRGYRGGYNDGGRGYRGGYDGGRRGYGGGRGDERSYRGGYNGGGRGYHGGGHDEGRGYHGGGHDDGRGNLVGNREVGKVEYQIFDRNNGEVADKTIDANHPVNGGSESGSGKGDNNPRRNWIDNRDASSRDSRPPLTEDELERRKKYQEELERDAQLMTLAQYEKVLQDKRKELQEKLSDGGDNKKVEKMQAKTNETQDNKNTLQRRSYQRDSKNTSQKSLQEMRDMVYLSLQLSHYRPRRWAQNEQGVGTSSVRDKSTSRDDGQSKKKRDSQSEDDGQVPDMNEFPVLCSSNASALTSNEDKTV